MNIEALKEMRNTVTSAIDSVIDEAEFDEEYLADFETLQDQVRELLHLINEKGDVRETIQFKDLAREMEIYS